MLRKQFSEEKDNAAASQGFIVPLAGSNSSMRLAGWCETLMTPVQLKRQN
jgi:hypothetical protein